MPAIIVAERPPSAGARSDGQFGEALDLVRGEQVALAVDRMGREIEAEGVALGGHPLGQRPVRVARQADRRDPGVGRAAEQAVLAAGALVVRRGGVGEDGLGRGVDRGAIGLERVERARGGEAFELAAVEQLGIDPRGEIVEAT